MFLGSYFILDMNECKMDIHSCSHQCVNTPGSYICHCPEGLQLASDRLNCQQVVEGGTLSVDLKKKNTILDSQMSLNGNLRISNCR